MANRNRAEHRNVQAPRAFDADFKEQAGDDAECVIVNLSNNIIEIPVKDAKGKYIILGADVDKGIEGANQPFAKSTVGAVRRARMNPAFNMHFTGTRPALEVRSSIIIMDLGG